MTTDVNGVASKRHAGTRPPGPKGYPLVGVLPKLVRDPAGFCTAAMLEFNDLVRLNLGFASIYLVTLPDHIHHVLVDNHENYWKGKLFARARFLFGKGLVLNEGESWRHQRHLMQPAFAHRRVASLVPLMADVVEQRLAGWEAASLAGRPINMGKEMMSLTLRIITKTMFSLSITDGQLTEMARAFNTALHHMTLRMFTFFLPEWAPLKGRQGCREAVATLEAMTYRTLRERRESGQDPDDLLAMLLSARDEAGRGMSDLEIRDEVMTTLFGGYEATADALTWAWYLLDQHPDVDARMREEVAAVTGGRTPTFEDLPRLTYTAQVAEETMRLFPPFWFYTRTAHGDDEIGGHRVPAGALVLLCPYATHRNPAYWEEPAAFRPERFAPERAADRPRNAYFPFGTGQRMCIGRHLAMLEMQLILAMVAQRYRPRLTPGRPVVPRAGTSLRSEDGIWMIPERA
ncbi:MAG TPA: cytochrome P450 [Thermoanaerobaculia bacterium]|jgi:cytochrome P450